MSVLNCAGQEEHVRRVVEGRRGQARYLGESGIDFGSLRSAFCVALQLRASWPVSDDAMRPAMAPTTGVPFQASLAAGTTSPSAHRRRTPARPYT